MTKPCPDRRAALALLARATPRTLAPLERFWPTCRRARAAPGRSGLVMLRGRAGGDGAAFNLGEATVARAVVQLETGERGFGYCLGRDVEQARRIAVVDALWQRAGDRPQVEAQVLRPTPRACPRARAGRRRKRRRRGWTSSRSCAARRRRERFRGSRAGVAGDVRAVLKAMSRPGEILRAGEELAPPAPLHPAATAAC